MPELPEIEHLSRTLRPILIGSTVTRVRLERSDVLRPRRPRHRRADLLAGQQIVRVERHGKQLALISDARRVLVVGLGMSGQLLHVEHRQRLDRSDHVHCRWQLERDGLPAGRLVFRDPRRFGGLSPLCDPDALAERWAHLGPDALHLDPDTLADRCAASHRPIKALLLDQSRVAGIGNIYADEALFAARVHPLRPAATLSAAEIARLCAAITDVLEAAVVAGGSTLRDYRDARGEPGAFTARHQVYGRAGAACPRCGSKLARRVVAQRGTVLCPACQPLSTSMRPVRSRPRSSSDRSG